MNVPLEPVLLTEVPTEMEASLLQAALAERGVRAAYNGAAISGFAAEAPAMVRVLVDRTDYDAARKWLDDRQDADATMVDWTRVDVGQAEDA